MSYRVGQECPFNDYVCALGLCRVCGNPARELTRDEQAMRIQSLAHSTAGHWDDEGRTLHADVAAQLTEPPFSRRGPEILVLPLARAVTYQPDPSRRTVCISITTPGNERPVLSAGFADVLRLEFVDADHKWDPEWTGEWLTVLRARASGQRTFTHGLAYRVLGFAQRNQTADLFIIHCEAGGSRSPGVALGLRDVLWPDLDIGEWPRHNRAVREMLNHVGQCMGDDVTLPGDGA